MNLGTVRDIMEIIHQGHGGPDMSSVDRVVASNIVSYLQKAGWMGAEEIAHIVQAAGGEVRISEKQLDEGPKAIYTQRDPITHDIVLRSVSVVDTKNAKVNPDAESRTVHSGSIKVSPVAETQAPDVPSQGNVK
jgi:hypothetical protein